MKHLTVKVAVAAYLMNTFTSPALSDCSLFEIVSVCKSLDLLNLGLLNLTLPLLEQCTTFHIDCLQLLKDKRIYSRHFVRIKNLIFTR